MVVSCHKCFLVCANTRDLEKHLDRKVPCDAGQHKCIGCGNGYKTRKSLQDHKKRCKGKSEALLAHERAIEIEQLKSQACQQDQLMQMTNAVTAAASASSNQVTNIGVQNNITNHNSITINVHKNVSNLGEEKLSHFSQLSDSEMLDKLQLIKGPDAFETWCALLRADEHHPENHNALLLAVDSKEMACCRGGKWCWGDTEAILLEISRNDMNRLHTHLGRYDQNSNVQDYRNEYLVHDVMTRATTGDTKLLKPIMSAIARPIIEMTQKYYACTVEDNTPPEIQSLKARIDTMEDNLRERQAEYDKMLAKDQAVILEMRRDLSQLSQSRVAPQGSATSA